MDAADLVFAGISRQAQLVRDGEVSPRELVQACLDRIEALDPRLNAWRIVLAEKALAEAGQAEGRRGAGDDRPLLGVPLAIKDDLRVAGTTTAWGTAAHGPEVPDDAVLVQRLREAGAIVLGKTNVPEMTIWPFTESKTFGPTRNPWDPSRTTGGSSGGTGAAVAAGMVGAGTGSDGGGSIRIPSGWCGLFGLKPTRDLVPIAPHVDAWQGLSVNGFLTRSVADTALLLDATVQRAPATPFAQAVRPPDRKLRIAWSVKRLPGAAPFPKLDPDHRRALEETAALLRSLGHEVYERDPDYGAGAFPQYLAPVPEGHPGDIDSMEHPERLEKRTLGMGGWALCGALRRSRDSRGGPSPSSATASEQPRPRRRLHDADHVDAAAARRQVGGQAARFGRSTESPGTCPTTRPSTPPGNRPQRALPGSRRPGCHSACRSSARWTTRQRCSRSPHSSRPSGPGPSAAAGLVSETAGDRRGGRPRRGLRRCSSATARDERVIEAEVDADGPGQRGRHSRPSA